MWDTDANMRASDRARSGELKRRLDPAALDAARERIEFGPGGDVDVGGQLTRSGRIYVPSLKRTVSHWLRLYERVQRGDLGGPTDGLWAVAHMRPHHRLRMDQLTVDAPAAFLCCPLY